MERDESVPIPKEIEIIIGNARYLVSMKISSVVGDLDVDQWNCMKFGPSFGKIWKRKSSSVNLDTNLIDLDITDVGVVITHVDDRKEKLYSISKVNNEVHVINPFNTLEQVIVEETETDSDDVNAFVFRANNSKKVMEFIKYTKPVKTAGCYAVEVEEANTTEENSLIVEIIREPVHVIEISDNSRKRSAGLEEALG